MKAPKQTRLQKLFEYWEAGTIVVVTAVVCALVAVPRPAVVDDIPLPRANLRVVSERSLLDAARAGALEKQRPDYDVRALGEALRQYGAADADTDTERGSRNIQKLAEVMGPALAQGPEAILSLRAYQMKVFLRELAVYESTGKESVELRELGGGIIAMLKRSQWLRPEGSGYRILPDRTVLEILFRKRWNEITGLKEPPFAVSLDEERIAYAFMLTHPIVPATAPPDQASQCRAANQYLLRKAGELAAIDPDYPGELARGMILLRMGRPKEAVDVLAARLDRRDDGPYTMLTRNALRVAQEKLGQ